MRHRLRLTYELPDAFLYSKTRRSPPCPYHLQTQLATGSRTPATFTTMNDTTATHNPSVMYP